MDVYKVTVIDRGPGGDLSFERDLPDGGLFAGDEIAMQYCLDHPTSSGGVYDWEGNLFKGGLKFGDYRVSIVPVAETASREDINNGITNAALDALRELAPNQIVDLLRAGVTIPEGLLKERENLSE